MKSKLKGITLIETILYVGVLSIILFIIFSFMLSTREATVRTEQRSDVYSTSEFITQHLDYIFTNVQDIDELKSVFENDNGILYVDTGTGEHYYKREEDRLVFDGTPISPSKTPVQKFFLEPVQNKKGETIGVRITFKVVALRREEVMNEITTLYTIR